MTRVATRAVVGAFVFGRFAWHWANILAPSFQSNEEAASVAVNAGPDRGFVLPVLATQYVQHMCVGVRGELK